MGKSNSISQQQKDNQQFQDYIDKQTANLDALSKDAQQQIADNIRQAIDEVYLGVKEPKQALDDAAKKSAEVLGWS